MPENPTSVVSAPVSTPASEPPKDNGIRSWGINGKQTRVQTGVVKTGKNKGQPQFRFIFHPEEPNTNPTWADVTQLAAVLEVADPMAVIVNREVLRDLAHEVSLKITETTPEGVKTLNTAKIAQAAKEVVESYLADKETGKKLSEEIGELSATYQSLANEVVAAALSGINVKADPELSKKANQLSQLTLKIQELNVKLANLSRKKAAAAANAANPTTVAAVAAAAAAPKAPAPAK